MMDLLPGCSFHQLLRSLREARASSPNPSGRPQGGNESEGPAGSLARTAQHAPGILLHAHTQELVRPHGRPLGQGRASVPGDERRECPAPQMPSPASPWAPGWRRAQLRETGAQGPRGHASRAQPCSSPPGLAPGLLARRAPVFAVRVLHLLSHALNSSLQNQ